MKFCFTPFKASQILCLQPISRKSQSRLPSVILPKLTIFDKFLPSSSQANVQKHYWEIYVPKCTTTPDFKLATHLSF